MSEKTVSKIRLNQGQSVNRRSSRQRQAARKAGIDIPAPALSLPETEQEDTDIV